MNLSRCFVDLVVWGEGGGGEMKYKSHIDHNKQHNIQRAQVVPELAKRTWLHRTSSKKKRGTRRAPCIFMLCVVTEQHSLEEVAWKKQKGSFALIGLKFFFWISKMLNLMVLHSDILAIPQPQQQRFLKVDFGDHQKSSKR